MEELINLNFAEINEDKVYTSNIFDTTNFSVMDTSPIRK